MIPISKCFLFAPGIPSSAQEPRGDLIVLLIGMQVYLALAAEYYYYDHKAFFGEIETILCVLWFPIPPITPWAP